MGYKPNIIFKNVYLSHFYDFSLCRLLDEELLEDKIWLFIRNVCFKFKSPICCCQAFNLAPPTKNEIILFINTSLIFASRLSRWRFKRERWKKVRSTCTYLVFWPVRPLVHAHSPAMYICKPLNTVLTGNGIRWF